MRHSLYSVLLIVFCLSNSFAQDDYRELYERASELGLSETEIMSLALSQGYSFQELDKFNQSIDQQDLVNARIRQFSNIQQDTTATDYQKELFFGAGFFARGFGLTFQPDENMPTPPDYVLGPGDELYVDIYGVSEEYYNTTISPDGYITLVNIGKINAQGRTIAELKEILIRKFGTVYRDLISNRPRTFLQVGLINVKSIQVHLAGEINVAGTYTLNGFSTVMNALYAAGGPTPTGSFRSIQILRGGAKVNELDLYKFLLKGDARQNVRLQSNDVILVPPYENRVSITGEVKRPTRYETKPGETVADLITYAGGFTPLAYKESLSVVRPAEADRVVGEIYEQQLELFPVMAGDEYTVHSTFGKFSNRVLIEGAVMRPGNYALDDSLTVSRLVEKAGGYRPDAFLGYGVLSRTNEELTITTQQLDFRSISSGDSPDIVLQPEDRIIVQSKFDLDEKQFVKISGEVNDEGTFPFFDGLVLSDVLFLAKGVKQSGRGGFIEISRRASNQQPTQQREIIKIPFDVSDSLGNPEFSVPLASFDHIMVRKNPQYMEETIVTVSGEVNFPGEYTLISRNEKISDLIERSGGTNEWAFIEGATLIRKTEYYKSENEIQGKIDFLNEIRAQYDSTDIEAEVLYAEKLDQEIALLRSRLEQDNSSAASTAKRNRLEEIKSQNPLLANLDVKRNEAIPLKLQKIMQNPEGKENLTLEAGDHLIIPSKSETVRLRGKVLYPSTVSFASKKSARYYVNQSGGFDQRALKRNTYVLYPNGEVARTKSLWFFKVYPEVLAGSEVIVPQKPVRVPLRPGEIVNITTGLSALAVLLINQLSTP